MIAGGDHAAHEGDLPRLPEQPDRRRPRPGGAARRSPRWPTSTTCWSSPTRSTTGSCTATTQHTAFSSLPGMRERTVLLGGFSKSYAMTGWRIGYVAAPAGLMEGIAKVHQYGIMCAPTAAQYAAIEALTQRRAGRGRRCTPSTTAAAASSSIGSTRSAWRRFEPKGAFYCFPRVTDATGLDETAFAERLLAEETGRASCPASRSVRRAPATCASATPRRTRRSSRRWSASSGSSTAIGRDAAGVDQHAPPSPAPRPTTRPRWRRPWHRLPPRSWRRAMLRSGETVLDVGTGTGTAARLAGGRGRRVIGLDARTGMLEIARAEVAGDRVHRGRFHSDPTRRMGRSTR